MATNKPVGVIQGRLQGFNPQNQNWTKRATGTGRFMEQKADPDPFKNIRKEKRK